ncbi:MAG: Na+/H+ antiporter subunit C [Bacteroidia bacterium]|nr:Na+/H+ antiporter subunit C [Bacteroidia bacterium]
MTILLSILSGALFAAGVYLLLRRNLIRIVLGLIFIGHAANLLILLSDGLSKAAPPIIAQGRQVLEPPYADPLPQALILTAIVISFGVFAFFLVLIKRSYQVRGSDDIDQFRESGT